MSAVFDCWFPVSTAMKPFYVIQSRIQDRTLKRNINDNNQVNGEVGKRIIILKCAFSASHPAGRKLFYFLSVQAHGGTYSAILMRD